MKIREIIAFLVILIIQIVFINNLGLTIITPAIYIYIIIKLPFSINSIYVMLIGFFIGALFDLSVMTPGVQSFCMTLIAFLRTPIRNIFLSKDMQTNSKIPPLLIKGNKEYLFYAITMITVYYAMWQSVDGMLFINTLRFFMNIVIGSVLTIVLLIVFDRIFFSRRVNKLTT